AWDFAWVHLSFHCSPVTEVEGLPSIQNARATGVGPNHSQRNTRVDRAVYAANSTNNAATFTQCAPHPDPSHTPLSSATACVVGNRYANALSERGNRSTG